MSAFAPSEPGTAPARTQASAARVQAQRPERSIAAPPLRLSRPSDPSEREAELIAERIARDEPQPQRVRERFENAIARSACDGCSDDAPCADCEDEHEEEEPSGVLVQRAGLAGAPETTGPLANGRWAGTTMPLPPTLRTFFGERLGANLDAVRLHTGAEPAAAARTLAARAFTVGRDVVFGEGEYRPESLEGRKLIAHELVHTLQQGDAEIRRTITVSNPSVTPAGHSQSWGRTVVGLFNSLCPSITWSLDAQGRLQPANATDCGADRIAASSTPRSCGCICSFLTDAGPHATIIHDPVLDETVGSGNSYEIKITGQAATGIEGVFRQSDPPAGGSSRQTLSDPPWLILGHELCGHAGGTYPANRGMSAHQGYDHEMNRDPTSAVDIENEIRAEHSGPGTDLGIRMGDFLDADGNKHFGSRIVLPRAMQLITLLQALNVPIGAFFARCVMNNDGAELVYTGCASVPRTGLQHVRMLERVQSYTPWGQHVPYLCLWNTFSAGHNFAIEGIFWHRVVSGETKATIADRWGVTVQWLNRANRLFDPAVAALPDTGQLPAGTTLVIPYKWAPGTQRYFLERHTPAPGEQC